jgi:NAD(P)-dependent dehydrogenase (short-subunit alcohol dehydrogenase family)
MTEIQTAPDYANLFRLEDHRVIVVGAASGIGRECALAVAAHGAEVIVVDRDAGALDEVVAQLGAGSSRVVLDVLDAQAIRQFAEDVGPVDGLVFTPATNVRKSLSAYSEEEFDRVVSLNLTASFNLIRTFGPAMASQGGGSIVGFSSIRAITIEPGQGVYAATKAALEMLIRTAASEYGPSGVRVNAIRPGVVETALTLQLRANPEWNEAYAQKAALRRWARPDEMTGAVVYLVSDASTFVTGSVITVDGGWTAQDGRYDPPLS